MVTGSLRSVRRALSLLFKYLVGRDAQVSVDG